jgi:hypothetical protein
MQLFYFKFIIYDPNVKMDYSMRVILFHMYHHPTIRKGLHKGGKKKKTLFLEHLDTPPRKLVRAFVWSLLSTCKKVFCFMAPSLLQEISQKVAFKRDP